MQKDTEQMIKGQSSKRENKRSLENILDEYKILSLQLFKQAGIVTENEIESTTLSIKQADLLDQQQALLIEAQSLKIKSDKDIVALLQLWKSEEVYNDDISPSQGLVLHLQEYFENSLA